MVYRFRTRSNGATLPNNEDRRNRLVLFCCHFKLGGDDKEKG